MRSGPPICGALSDMTLRRGSRGTGMMMVVPMKMVEKVVSKGEVVDMVVIAKIGVGLSHESSAMKVEALMAPESSAMKEGVVLDPEGPTMKERVVLDPEGVTMAEGVDMAPGGTTMMVKKAHTANTMKQNSGASGSWCLILASSMMGLPSSFTRFASRMPADMPRKPDSVSGWLHPIHYIIRKYSRVRM